MLNISEVYPPKAGKSQPYPPPPPETAEILRGVYPEYAEGLRMTGR